MEVRFPIGRGLTQIDELDVRLQRAWSGKAVDQAEIYLIEKLRALLAMARERRVALVDKLTLLAQRAERCVAAMDFAWLIEKKKKKKKKKKKCIATLDQPRKIHCCNTLLRTLCQQRQLVPPVPTRRSRAIASSARSFSIRYISARSTALPLHARCNRPSSSSIAVTPRAIGTAPSLFHHRLQRLILAVQPRA